MLPFSVITYRLVDLLLSGFSLTSRSPCLTRSAKTLWVRFQDMFEAYMIFVGFVSPSLTALRTVSIISSLDLRVVVSLDLAILINSYWRVPDSTMHSVMYCALFVVTLILTAVPMSSIWMFWGPLTYTRMSPPEIRGMSETAWV